MDGLNRLAGKVAIVTGAPESIGEAIPKLFLEEEVTSHPQTPPLDARRSLSSRKWGRA